MLYTIVFLIIDDGESKSKKARRFSNSNSLRSSLKQSNTKSSAVDWSPEVKNYIKCQFTTLKQVDINVPSLYVLITYNNMLFVMCYLLFVLLS